MRRQGSAPGDILVTTLEPGAQDRYIAGGMKLRGLVALVVGMFEPSRDCRGGSERIAANAMVQLWATGLDWLAPSGVAWVVAPLVLASAVVLIVLLPVSSERPTARWSEALAPQDAAARVMVSSEHPPDIAALLLSEANCE